MTGAYIKSGLTYTLDERQVDGRGYGSEPTEAIITRERAFYRAAYERNRPTCIRFFQRAFARSGWDFILGDAPDEDFGWNRNGIPYAEVVGQLLELPEDQDEAVELLRLLRLRSRGRFKKNEAGQTIVPRRRTQSQSESRREEELISRLNRFRRVACVDIDVQTESEAYKRDVEGVKREVTESARRMDKALIEMGVGKGRWCLSNRNKWGIHGDILAPEGVRSPYLSLATHDLFSEAARRANVPLHTEQEAVVLPNGGGEDRRSWPSHVVDNSFLVRYPDSRGNLYRPIGARKPTKRPGDPPGPRKVWLPDLYKPHEELIAGAWRETGATEPEQLDPGVWLAAIEKRRVEAESDTEIRAEVKERYRRLPEIRLPESYSAEEKALVERAKEDQAIEHAWADVMAETFPGRRSMRDFSVACRLVRAATFSRDEIVAVLMAMPGSKSSERGQDYALRNVLLSAETYERKNDILRAVKLGKPKPTLREPESKPNERLRVAKQRHKMLTPEPVLTSSAALSRVSAWTTRLGGAVLEATRAGALAAVLLLAGADTAHAEAALVSAQGRVGEDRSWVSRIVADVRSRLAKGWSVRGAGHLRKELGTPRVAELIEAIDRDWCDAGAVPLQADRWVATNRRVELERASEAAWIRGASELATTLRRASRCSLIWVRRVGEDCGKVVGLMRAPCGTPACEACLKWKARLWTAWVERKWPERFHVALVALPVNDFATAQAGAEAARNANRPEDMANIGIHAAPGYTCIVAPAGLEAIGQIMHAAAMQVQQHVPGAKVLTEATASITREDAIDVLGRSIFARAAHVAPWERDGPGRGLDTAGLGSGGGGWLSRCVQVRWGRGRYLQELMPTPSEEDLAALGRELAAENAERLAEEQGRAAGLSDGELAAFVAQQTAPATNVDEGGALRCMCCGGFVTQIIETYQGRQLKVIEKAPPLTVNDVFEAGRDMHLDELLPRPPN